MSVEDEVRRLLSAEERTWAAWQAALADVPEERRTGADVTEGWSVQTEVAHVGAWFDEAAGVLLVREAGGFVSDYRGADRSFERREYIAASSAIHSKLQKLIAGALR